MSSSPASHLSWPLTLARTHPNSYETDIWKGKSKGRIQSLSQPRTQKERTLWPFPCIFQFLLWQTSSHLSTLHVLSLKGLLTTFLVPYLLQDFYFHYNVFPLSWLKCIWWTRDQVSKSFIDRCLENSRAISSTDYKATVNQVGEERYPLNSMFSKMKQRWEYDEDQDPAFTEYSSHVGTWDQFWCYIIFQRCYEAGIPSTPLYQWGK